MGRMAVTYVTWPNTALAQGRRPIDVSIIWVKGSATVLWISL